MRIWLGGQKKGAVVAGVWKGAEPLWNLGVHIKSKEVQQGLRLSEVLNAIEETLKNQFPSYSIVISPKAREGLLGKYDGLKWYHSSGNR